MHLNGVQLAALLSFCVGSAADRWPYHRYQGTVLKDGGPHVPDKTSPEFEDIPSNEFGQWLRRVVTTNDDGQLASVFKNGVLPHDATFDEIYEAIDVPEADSLTRPILGPGVPIPNWTKTASLFAHLGYPLDPNCLSDDFKWRFRTYDGSCNWLQQGETQQGAFGQAHARDYGQHYYADGIGTPREGPNPRAVSNAFFKRNQTVYYEHTPFMLGLVEFIMHDVTYSMDSQTEFIEVPMPEDEEYFDQSTRMNISRTEKVAGTGTSKHNPRENINRATSWLDVSSLYGSSMEVARKLRSYEKGKLLTQESRAPGTRKAASYLPFNTMNVPTRTRPGVQVTDLFAGGDPRTNEDWIMLAVHHLFLREHNRLCDILAKKHPEFDDERLYQTVRLLMGAKMSLIGNAYQMAYWTASMPWPRDDGFPLYREMYGENFLQINPANTYPWPLVTKNGKPITVSVEMAVVYRFHEFIISSFPIKNALNETIREQDLFQTGFDAKGFVETGLENIIRGLGATHIPNFKSGVDEAFRSAGKYRGAPFDIIVWSLVHEREQGLPTFNQYFEAYNKQDPNVVVPIRKRFEDFTTNPEHVAALKRLYKSPDEVDLVVGCQLDEELFPHTSVPKSSLVISLFSLFGAGNSDRFSVGFAAMRCFLVDKPWDCHPSNALEELLWKPMPSDAFPNFRFYDTFWMTELDLPAHGTNLLWRLVTENTEIKCLQKDPLFPVDEITNPILCSLPPQKIDIIGTLSSFLEIFLVLIRQYAVEILTFIAVLVASAVFVYIHQKPLSLGLNGLPRVIRND